MTVPLHARRVIGLLGCLLAAMGAHADIPWRHATVGLQAQGQPVAEVLRRFTIAQGLQLEIGDDLATTVAGDFQGYTPREFLDAVCDASDLAWFWDGSRLHVHRAAEIQTRSLPVTAVAVGQAAAVLPLLGFESGPAPRAATVRGVEGVLTLSGGPRFLEVAEPILLALDAQEKARLAEAGAAAAAAAQDARRREGEMEVRVFRLKYATAGDLTIEGGSSQTVVPGVARALQNIMGTTSGALSTGVAASTRPRQQTGLLGSGLAAVGQPAPANATEPDVGLRADARADDQMQTLIQADPRLNAVIVRDLAGRMPLYENLIAELDVPSPVIEIAAAVVDIDTSNGRSLGVEFLSFGDGNSSTIGRIGFEADRQYNQGDGGNTGTDPTFSDSPDLVRGPGLLSSVLVPVNGYELLVRVRALEEKGAAQLVTSPSVITLENVEAVLRQEETVYVRVAGREATDLFDVHAGVQLRVTPTVVQEGDQLMFRLVVNVQDGSFSDLLVDGVPSTRESAINTQALVPADRTLLIGGYFVEREINNARQVPVLGDVPLLGRLFKRTENGHTRAQRYFFITPRLVDVHRESRLNRPAVPAGETPLPPELSQPEPALDRAHELAGRTLAPVAAVASPLAPSW